VTDRKEAVYIEGSLSVSKCVLSEPIDHHSRTDPVDIGKYGNDHLFGQQVFVWGGKSQQIVAAGSGNCLTLGAPNLGNGDGNSPGKPGAFTNNGTLEHEVWQGMLTPTGHANRQVVALFNKGELTETITAAPEIIARGNGAGPPATWTARDVVAGKDLPKVAPGEMLRASVPGHGVALFVLEQSA
jgi:hypothetical protein